ncbi:protein AGENET DOMAIN (AGD)-CONTAINING P1-like [Zingiber officinale]|nr:protein AGENET DOMAIN (AGD)-CONTAINING P1-like [Zingiber officinale]XP_042393331.1 protein AGENET DOMAIN (AGD)-CONTAINING P1-like [Zingiber officinale]
MAPESGGEKKLGDRRGSVWFQPRDPVEVRSDDGFFGAWYEATAASSLPQHRVEIVYSTIVDNDDPSLPLREIVLVSQLRPRSPPPPLPAASTASTISSRPSTKTVGGPVSSPPSSIPPADTSSPSLRAGRSWSSTRPISDPTWSGPIAIGSPSAM